MCKTNSMVDALLSRFYLPMLYSNEYSTFQAMGWVQAVHYYLPKWRDEALRVHEVLAQHINEGKYETQEEFEKALRGE